MKTRKKEPVPELLAVVERTLARHQSAFYLEHATHEGAPKSTVKCSCGWKAVNEGLAGLVPQHSAHVAAAVLEALGIEQVDCIDGFGHVRANDEVHDGPVFRLAASDARLFGATPEEPA